MLVLKNLNILKKYKQEERKIVFLTSYEISVLVELEQTQEQYNKLTKEEIKEIKHTILVYAILRAREETNSNISSLQILDFNDNINDIYFEIPGYVSDFYEDATMSQIREYLKENNY